MSLPKIANLNCVHYRIECTTMGRRISCRKGHRLPCKEDCIDDTTKLGGVVNEQ